MKKFKSETNKQELIKHLEVQKQNTNDDDNLSCCYLTLKEIEILQKALKTADLKEIRKEDLVIALKELSKIKIVLENTISFLESKSD